MAIFKCKMCGGTLEVGNETVATCEYCGTKQTLPRLDDERRAQMYDRANHFRRNNEFDKAIGIYESILNEDHTDAEAYWSLVLCRYGIEYVEDPASRKRVPTINRAQFTSIFEDDNYKSALQYADLYQRGLYEEEAKAINEIQKGILAISQQEEPFDVFICYKETDENGRRTPDSVIAQDLYYLLTQEGFKVFFSRITLEDKLGSAYEPYIFAALNSAKVMVALGTKAEHFNAVWVKNEWSRYLALIKNGAQKMLIPAYRDMDPYDLPEEFSHLQAQNMGKLGFMQDLTRGIQKIIGGKQEEKPTAQSTVIVQETTTVGGEGNIPTLLKRAFMFLEDGEWNRADAFCEQVLNIDPECAEAYLGKLMAEMRCRKQEQLAECEKSLYSSSNYQKLMRFADTKLKNKLSEYNKQLAEREKTKQISRRKRVLMILGVLVCAVIVLIVILNTFIVPNSQYQNAVELMEQGEYAQAIEEFEALGAYKDSLIKIDECKEMLKVEKIKDRLKSAQVGDYITFGSYEQDNDLSNNEEDVEWLVLDAHQDKILVISKYALVCQSYHSENTSVTWKSCDLRAWLNDQFFNTAFNEVERAMISETTVSMDQGSSYNTDIGYATQDRVFLLSTTEVEKYADSDISMPCEPTEYTLANGVGTTNIGSCGWWLRSLYTDPEADPMYTAYVCGTDCDIYRDPISQPLAAVRPAMWITLPQ